MIRIKQFAVYLLCSASFIACSGDEDRTLEDYYEENVFVRVDSTNTNGSFTGNMNLNLETSAGESRTLMIDLDADGNNDLQLKSDYNVSSGGVNYRATSLKPMHSDVIVLNEVANLKMAYRETPSQGGGVYKIYEDYDSTKTYDSTYIIKDRYVQRPVALKYNDSVDRESFFASSNDLTFASRDQSRNDISQSSNLSDNYWVSVDESKYMAFKLRSNNVNYGGWVKLRVSDYNRLKVESLYLQPFND